MIFFLLFSKSVNAYSRRSERLLIYLCTVLFFAVVLFCIIQIFFLQIEQSHEQMGSQIEPSISFFSDEILFSLYLLFFLLSSLGGEAVRMVRKDLDAAEIAFQAWVNERKKGKWRFVFKQVFGSSLAMTLLAALSLVALVALLIAYPALRGGANPITLGIAILIVIGIWVAIALGVWHLNIKYQDEVLRLIRQR